MLASREATVSSLDASWPASSAARCSALRQDAEEWAAASWALARSVERILREAAEGN